MLYPTELRAQSRKRAGQSLHATGKAVHLISPNALGNERLQAMVAGASITVLLEHSDRQLDAP